MRPWYGTVKNLIADAMRGDMPGDTDFTRALSSCIQSVVEQTARREDGALRLRVVNETVKDRNKYVSGVAMEYYISERTVNRYTSEFVYAVAKRMGYKA